MSYRLPHDRFYRLCSACWLTSSAILCTLLAPLHAQCVHITGYDVVYASHQLSYVNNKITHNWLCVVHNIITWPVLSYRLTHDRFCRLCSARWLTAFAILRTSFAPFFKSVQNLFNKSALNYHSRHSHTPEVQQTTYYSILSCCYRYASQNANQGSRQPRRDVC